MSAKVVPLHKGETYRNATSGRLPNNVYRIREHLTEAEMEKLLAALKRKPAWSPRLADRADHLPPRPTGLGGLRSALG
jgi:hypothetical protein